MDKIKPNFYAIIPADVRYHEKLSANAKLLYGEIAALIGKDGYCFASNQYFVEQFGLTKTSVARLITQLEEYGFIVRELEKDESGKVERRKLYLSVSMPDVQPLNNIVNTPPQNCGEGGIKNVKDINTSNTVYIGDDAKKSKSAPLTDTQLRDLLVEWIEKTAQEDWTTDEKNGLYIALRGFYAPRENKKQEPAHTKAGFSALGNRLLRYSDGDPVEMIDLLELATSSGWKSVYERKGGSNRTNKPSGRKEGEVWI